ncbi:Gfo/Idh/MocA family protein [Rhizobium sp. SAFR-030]|uniref:Gfo/Idh/MocA family protein n=1 Tax=Rhizobium sp. SAFR-030 TaxID=3387277 RepID=UPI003F821A52
MENTLGWGILATGWIAGLFAQDLQAAGLNVTAVGSRSKNKAKDFAERYAIRNSHGSYEGLVTDPAVDIVYIATPHPHHVSAALLALEAGKHVMIEKPLRLTRKKRG